MTSRPQTPTGEIIVTLPAWAVSDIEALAADHGIKPDDLMILIVSIGLAEYRHNPAIQAQLKALATESREV